MKKVLIINELMIIYCLCLLFFFVLNMKECTQRCLICLSSFIQTNDFFLAGPLSLNQIISLNTIQWPRLTLTTCSQVILGQHLISSYFAVVSLYVTIIQTNK